MTAYAKGWLEHEVSICRVEPKTEILVNVVNYLFRGENRRWAVLRRRQNTWWSVWTNFDVLDNRKLFDYVIRLYSYGAASGVMMSVFIDLRPVATLSNHRNWDHGNRYLVNFCGYRDVTLNAKRSRYSTCRKTRSKWWKEVRSATECLQAYRRDLACFDNEQIEAIEDFILTVRKLITFYITDINNSVKR